MSAPTTASHSPLTTRQRWAWLGPVGALVAAALFTPVLRELDVSPTAVNSFEFYAGLAGGWVWQMLYQRDFASRFVLWAALFALASFIGFIPGAEMDTTGPWAPPWAPLGVLAGVVLAEAWRRRRATRG